MTHDIAKKKTITPYIDGWVIIYSYFMPVYSIVKTISQRCYGPDALLQKAEGRVQWCIRSSTVPRGNSLTILQTGMKSLFYYSTLLMKYLAAFLEWSCCRRCGFVEKQKKLELFIYKKKQMSPPPFDVKSMSH